MTNTNTNIRQLIECKDEFVKIMDILLTYDEHSKKVGKVIPEHQHYARKALAASPLESLTVFIEQLDEYSFKVLASNSFKNGNIECEWVHEDGIQADRKQQSNLNHPVHKMVCMTDLYEKYSIPVENTDSQSVPSLRYISNSTGQT